MDSTTDLSSAPATAVATTPAVPRRDSGHPLIWAAVLVWLSVEMIGDGLLALKTMLSTATTSRDQTPTVTPS